MGNVKPRVLLVDDDIQVLATMSLYLKETAYVACVSSGRQAIEYVQANPVDMIFLDVNMPVMDGFKTLEQFRNLKECINVPVVFVTGQHDKYTVMNSAFMGTDGYLLKPVNKETLIQKVNEMCHRKNQQEKRKTILAVDDDMVFLKLINSYLEDTYNVVIINSAKLALTYLMKHTPDLILLDYQMPMYNGASFMNMLNKMEDGNKIPVIILSGVIDKRVLRECYESSPKAYLVKLVKKEVLLENIEKILNQ